MKYNYNFIIYEAVIEGPFIDSRNAEYINISGRESTEDEKGDYIIISPHNGNTTHAFETYDKMLKSDSKSTFWVKSKNKLDE